MRKLAISILAAIILLALLAGACAQPASTPGAAPTTAAPPKTLPIGISTPLTGTAAHHGTMMQNGTLLAIENQNAEGGVTIGGQKYMLEPIVRDNKWDLIVANSVAEELVFDKGVKAIAGPFVMDAISTQMVTEPNKVLMFALTVTTPQMTGPNKPYTFFTGFPFIELYDSQCAYFQKFYPEAKKMLTLAIDLPDQQVFTGCAQTICPRYGLEWIGEEKFPISITDFMPVITRVLAKNPDIIDTAQFGSLGGLGALEVKQLREAGFKGIIMVPGSILREMLEDAVPKDYLYKFTCGELDVNSPIDGEAYKSYGAQFQKRFNMLPNNLAYLEYNVMKGFFQFLNGQNTMDTTAWMEGFANYCWDGLWGFKSCWVGKPLFGINRSVLGPTLIQEYTNGKLEAKWSAPIPYDLVVEK